MISERTLKLTLEYNGARYHGWQVQPNAVTIQGELEACLARILGKPHRVHGSGRTDAGVHARAQVAHLNTRHGMSVGTLLKAMNATLTRDISVLAIEEMVPDFHARFSRHHKRYVYTIWNDPVRSVFWDAFSWHIPRPLDWSSISEACTLIVGQHDFSAFRAADCSARSPIRTILRCVTIPQDAPRWQIAFEGTGFLKQMVRTLVGTLVDVGIGRRSLDDFRAILHGRDRGQAGKTAVARGLCLEWVHYELSCRGDAVRGEEAGGGMLSRDDKGAVSGAD